MKNDSKRLSRWASHCVHRVNSLHIKRVNKIHQNWFTHTAKTYTERSFTHTVSTGSPRTPYTSTRCYLFWYKKELTESLTKKNGKIRTHTAREQKLSRTVKSVSVCAKWALRKKPNKSFAIDWAKPTALSARASLRSRDRVKHTNLTVRKSDEPSRRW